MTGTTRAARTGTMRDSLRLALMAGVGMVWGPIFYRVVSEIAEKGWEVLLSIVGAVALVGLLAWLFVEPFLRRIFGLHVDHESPKIGSKSFIKAAFAVLVTGIVLEPVVEYFTGHPGAWPFRIVEVFLAGSITFGWSRGGQRSWRLVTVYGLMFGILLAAPTGALYGIANYIQTKAQSAFIWYVWHGVLGAVVASMILSVPAGLLIDFAPRVPVWLRIGLGLATTVLALALYIHFLGRGFKTLGDAIIGRILPDLFMCLGWVLGILICPGGLAALTPRRERTSPSTVPGFQGGTVDGRA